MKEQNFLERNKKMVGLVVVLAIVVTAIQILAHSFAISLISLMGAVLLLLIVVKKWIWPAMWGFNILAETIALFLVIYFIMTMIYLIYVFVSLQFGWTGIMAVPGNNTLFYLGQSKLP